MPTLTREALYELVWTTPLKTLAERFAMSDVGIAKICKRLDIPRPAQGHWARVLHRQEAPRPPLPAKAHGVPDSIDLTEVASAPEGDPEVRREKPTLEMRETLAGAHPAVRQLAALLKNDGRQREEMRIVAHRGQATFRASGAQQNRALRILDALSRWLDGEGYRVALTPVPNDQWRYAFVVGSKEDSFRISILERQKQSDHIKTKKEKEDEARYGSSWAPKYDHQPAGSLTLEFLNIRYSSSCGRWSDGKATLESRLGDIALRVGEVFDELAAERARRAEEARLAQLDAQRRAREHERAQHDERLRLDLDEMSRHWEQARRIRAFLDAAEPAILAGCAEDPDARAWIVWARTYVNTIDPIVRAEQIPKLLAPRAAEGR